MNLADLEKIRLLAERRVKAITLADRIGDEELRLVIGTQPNQAEIVLTPAGRALIRKHAIETLSIEVADATDKLRDLGVNI